MDADLDTDSRQDASDDSLLVDKRKRQAKSRELVESGERSQESMFLISPEIVKKIKFVGRTTDF
jgi:hypothetical protein